jgi:hypothetical protein
MKKAILIQEPGAVRSRLLELGIPDQELLRDAIAEGEVARSSYHKNVPGMAVGCIGWGVVVGAVRNKLAPHGWIPSSEGRLETTLNLTTMIAIAVTTGDEATGRADQTPCTKHQKGVATEKAIAANNRQLSLLSVLSPDHPSYAPNPVKLQVVPATPSSDENEADDVPEGVLLYELLKVLDGDEIRCELSLPLGYSVDGYVRAWAERIILEPIQLDGHGKAVTLVEPTPEIDVHVTRRSQVR